jgi:hypothetical protein
MDTIVKTVTGRDIRILQNHKFLAGSLGLGSGVMVNAIPFSLCDTTRVLDKYTWD